MRSCTQRIAGAFRLGKLAKDTSLQLGQPAELLAGGPVQQVLPPAPVKSPVNAWPQPQHLTAVPGNGLGNHPGTPARDGGRHRVWLVPKVARPSTPGRRASGAANAGAGAEV